MKRLILGLGFLVCGFVCVGQKTHGYINYDTVLQNHPEYAAMKQNLEDLQKPYEDSLQKLGKLYNNYFEHGIPHNIKEGDMKKFADSLRVLEKAIESYQYYAEKKIRDKNDSATNYLRSKIKTELKYFCIKNKIEMISDTESVLYCESCIDYTKLFIAYLKKE